MSPRSPRPTTNPTLPPHNDGPLTSKQSPLNLIQNLINTLQNDPILMEDVESLMVDAASSRGVLLRHPEVADALRTAPVTLFPTVIEKECLDQIVNLQSSINGLMHKVAFDREFIEAALKGAASVDPFIASLLDIYRQVDVEQQWQLGLFRSDYLQQQLPMKRNGATGDTLSPRCPFKQVEVNTICAGLAGIGSLIPPCHHAALQFLAPSAVPPSPVPGDSLQLFGDALSTAHGIYCREHPSPGRKILLMVIHDGYEFNIMDQRMVEGASGLKGIRRSFKELRETATVDEGGRLWVEGMEVAVVYFRTAYSPGHFDGKEDWDLRLMLEKSQAIKCPSVAYQLAGFKKIQQELSRKEVLSRYFPDDPSTVSSLLALNVAQMDLSSPSTQSISAAILHPSRYVLKPNREGGGNNLYHQDLVDKIKAVLHTPLAQDFILMEKIHPPTQINVLLRPGKETAVLETVSEVGVFGVVMGRGKEVVKNGTGKRVLVRCKEQGVNEGGLALGLACLGSAWVV